MLGAAYHWYLHRRVAGFILFAASMVWLGHGLSDAVANLGTSHGGVAATRTFHHSTTVTRTRFVTIHVRGKVLSRHDHILVVYVPRTVFRNHATNKRIVVPAHRVRIHEPTPAFGETSAVVGISPLPVTVTVPVYVTVPGPTTTIQGPTTTVTLPQDTTTVTIPTTTTTITLPPDTGP